MASWIRSLRREDLEKAQKIGENAIMLRALIDTTTRQVYVLSKSESHHRLAETMVGRKITEENCACANHLVGACIEIVNEIVKAQILKCSLNNETGLTYDNRTKRKALAILQDFISRSEIKFKSTDVYSLL